MSCYDGLERFPLVSFRNDPRLCDCSVCQRLHGAPVQWAALFQKNQVWRDDAVEKRGEDHVKWCQATGTFLVNIAGNQHQFWRFQKKV